ncbi:MAG: two-component system response regulator CreB [Pseudomonadota bacterium]
MATRILIVEDEAEIVDTLTYVFEREGMDSVWVSTGAAAKETLATSQFDFIVLDVGLPDCNGFELLKEIRQNYSQPVMMLTARSEEVDRIVGLEIGADDYVVKPFSPREVVARVRAILKRASGQESVDSEVFSIDLNAMIIQFCNQPLSLTRSEYLLLKTMIERPGQTFSRRQLIEKVWSEQHPSDDRAIDTHIKSLRAALKQVNPELSPIRTHRGFGYSLVT